MEKLLIAGEFVEAQGGETYEVRNPADTREVVGRAAKGTVEDAKKAVDTAFEAFNKWSEMSPSLRAQALRKASDSIREHAEEIAVMITKENGKPFVDARSEVRGFSAHLDFYAGVWPALRGAQVPMSDPWKFGVIMRRPVGVCVAIIPWNNPIIQLAQKLPPALVAGNTMVVKPASTTPLGIMRVGELLLEAGLPPGVVNIVTGSGTVLGPELIRSPKVAKVSFTGDTETGKTIMALAAEKIKRVTLELGGSDPMIVCDDANMELAIDGALFGRFRNTGQGCLCVKRLYLFEQIADEFLDKLTQRVKLLKVGNGMKPETKMGPCHAMDQRAKVESQVADAVHHGARIVAGGSRPRGDEYDHGYFYMPTVLADVDESSRIAKEECFGPALPVFVVKDLEEAIEKANDSTYGLSSSIFTNDINRAITAGKMIQAGKTLVNTAYDVSVELPHGGVKQTGIGREDGLEVFDYYTEPKVVMIDTSTERPKWLSG